ncbi:hypothetical protein [uncultured Porphyromonas sp.]|uniref:hypothetical protein n=1 Tax=uncultured Porphyromonas sp. TaxID=159274 RepID=UPI002588B0A9|nr:hypothetical protein [uncultured Porphyromonas sp.]
MAEDKAIEYEYLIRSAFNCGRCGVVGANADTYRSLERQVASANSEKGDQFELGFAMGRVVAYIENALKKVQKEHSANKEFIAKIDDCLSLITSDPTMEKIDDCVDQAREAFKSIGLF